MISNTMWYKDAIIYELHVKAFKDSNGDGIGDFRGLTEKLDYLVNLGVTAVWLLPFYPSPQKDDGYDISDYYNVHPDYGTLHDFKEFLKEAHNRGLKVITELVLNHTSNEHPWAQAALTGDEDARELYAGLPAEKRFDACTACGLCEQTCPNRLKIVDKLREAHTLLA